MEACECHTLRERLARLEALVMAGDIRYEQRFLAQEKAIAKAEAGSDKQFAAVNEFRALVTDREQRFVSRAEHDSTTDKIEGPTGLTRRLEEVARRVDTYISRDAGVIQETERVGAVRQWQFTNVINLIVGVLALIGVVLLARFR